jgi:dephospho-CoA kinase
LVAILGITGGIGSGKSTASQILGGLGALVIDADIVGHKIYQPDTPAWREIVDTFGADVVAPDRTIDRAKLGPIVFSAPEKLEALNKIMHGKIYAYIQGQIDYVRDHDPNRVIAVEAAILLEAGWRSLVEALWVVVASEDVVINRLQIYKNMGEAQARARINAQMTNDERIAQADQVIWNNDGLPELRQAVEASWQRLNL